jgi:UDP-N-acetylmuramyl pentapeptide phosphotransferase/UDP-N-acetylglucosamine-1-phosphate transferase
MILVVCAAAFAAVFGATVLALGRLVPWLSARRILDIPNERSSHVASTPRGGGLAPVGALALAGLAGAGLSGQLWPLAFAAAAAALSVLCFNDDRRSLGIGVRLGAQALSIVVAYVLVVSGWPDVLGGRLPAVVLAPLLLIGWLWFVNLFNFMDGIDGISGVETVTIGLGAGVVTLVAAGGAPLGLEASIIIAGACLAGAGAGFLTANWSPARVFLGDAGSIPLGFLCGALLIALAGAGHLAAALVIPAYYIVDATATLLLRLARGEPVWQAHRSHAYQLAYRAGLSHAAICLRIIGCNVLLLAFALLSILSPVAGLAAGYATAFATYGWLARGGRLRTAGPAQ